MSYRNGHNFKEKTRGKKRHQIIINIVYQPEHRSNIWININDTLMPATANGYSQAARLPSCLNNNLLKDAFNFMLEIISDSSSLVERQISETEITRAESTREKTTGQKFSSVILTSQQIEQEAYRVSPGKKQQILKGNETATPEESTLHKLKYILNHQKGR